MWLITHLHRQLLEWTKETQPVEIPGKLMGPKKDMPVKRFYQCPVHIPTSDLHSLKNYFCLSTMEEAF